MYYAIRPARQQARLQLDRNVRFWQILLKNSGINRSRRRGGLLSELSQARTTERYAHLAIDAQKRAADATTSQLARGMGEPVGS